MFKNTKFFEIFLHLFNSPTFCTNFVLVFTLLYLGFSSSSLQYGVQLSVWLNYCISECGTPYKFVCECCLWIQKCTLKRPLLL